MVSIHAPTRGATVIIESGALDFALFQSTHPHGVRRFLTPGVLNTRCFNPRTHTGCDDFEASFFIDFTVSIHAPTRGATASVSLDCTASTRFQSTHPHGVRPNKVDAYKREQEVSIHAPTRGATYEYHPNTSELGFNPRTHTGCDSVQSYIL